MNNTENLPSQEVSVREFNEDSELIGRETEKFLKLVYPSYLEDKENINSLIDRNSSLRLQSMTFFRINSCTADNVDKVFQNVNEHFEKLFTALYSINIPVAYGIVSYKGITNLVLGVYNSSDVEIVKTIVQGMLTGIDINPIELDFNPKLQQEMHYGILAGVPSLYVKEQKQTFSLAPIMRSLNGQDYTLLFIAKPVLQERITKNISELISVRDNAFAVSKRNVARSSSYSKNTTNTNSITNTQNSVAGSVGAGAGAAIGALVGTFIVPGAGTALGGIVGGGLGSAIGAVIGKGKSRSEGYSKSISEAITNGTTISGDIQNGFALELMRYADNAIERLKSGQNNGIWQTAITYSADKKISRSIIRACLSAELSKLDSEKLPMLAFEPKYDNGEALIIPDFLENKNIAPNPLCSYLNSSELGMLCTVPTDSVPDFELRLEKKLPLVASRSQDSEINIGNVVDGKRTLSNMPFSLNEKDLNKHTFVCGITGSGKTTTVKKILLEAKKPFLVIESAKKEYRNIATDTMVYTPGKPEINAPQINPFYIMPGISPQTHIDFLKDLFNASFSFYGPMQYILEKCLHAVYLNKGWDLTLGYHPMLANSTSAVDFFNIEYIKKQYSCLSHKFLFPTMQELKDEINRYIENELKYDGEVAGNIKTAMKVRLENLCIGAKGYSFNTNEVLDFDNLLKRNVVFELEGLADDSDKAFSVGLLVIFINEYRQVQKEIAGNQNLGLQHLLVIEEAHRLLKNVDTEKSTELDGNSKGKAVEHFTNMIAEMRSYGQGVIVAEQIPTKLAPDVIKNSSTKIVQRIVSADDQQTIANTIGISGSDAIQLGTLETGYAYCHKEGMVLPTPVKITDEIFVNDKMKKLDVFVTDEQLYNNANNRFDKINLSCIKSFFGGNLEIERKVLAFINTIMVEDNAKCVKSCNKLIEFVSRQIKSNDINLVMSNDSRTTRIIAKYLTEVMLNIMIRGVYRTKVLPNNQFVELLESTLYAPTSEAIEKIKRNLEQLYSKSLSTYAKISIACLIKRNIKKNINIEGTICTYFIEVSDETINEIEKKVRGGK